MPNSPEPPCSRAEPALWRLLDTPPAPGAWNMALDEALAASVRAGGPPVLRFYRWRPACLSLGRNQPARGHYDEAALRARGIDVVRRPTGGRAVLHHRELTYAVAVADGALGGPRETYAAVNRALVAGLRRLGVAAVLQPRAGRADPPSLAPCFADPAEGEVVAGGRKLVGSAQRREGGVLLQHGSLLLEDDQSLLPALMGMEGPGDDIGGPSSSDVEPRPEDGPATLAGLLGAAPAWEALTAALAAGWEEALGVRLAPAEPTPDEGADAKRRAARYADPAWTWHR